jgi:DNA-binding winged helix-turn-helix (wHTH) protein/TolB-like protein
MRRPTIAHLCAPVRAVRTVRPAEHYNRLVLYRFATFEFDDSTGELKKSGRQVRLERQPALVLGRLLAHPGDIVTRETLRQAVWGDDVHVDFDRGLAYCLSQIRTALGDSGDNPRFVQTIPKRGYRFIAPVNVDAPATSAAAVAESEPRPAGQRLRWWTAVGGVALVVAATWMSGGTGESGAKRIIAVSVFDNETGQADLDRQVAGLSDVVVARLTTLSPERLAIIGNAAVLRQPRNIRNLKAVASGVQADYVLLGQLQREPAGGYRFITHFIRLSDQAHLKANRLVFADGDLTELDARVVAEFERAVRSHVLETGGS